MKQTNFVAFDLEIAKPIPGDFNQWRLQRPLGISCAGLAFDGSETQVWYGKREDGAIAERMSREEAARMVGYLVQAAEKGWEIVTWNGLGFDFDVLAEESGRWEDCKRLALQHTDMMFHLFCEKGYPLALDKAAKGMGLAGKTPGMTGEMAPILWQAGKYAQVLEYVKQDVLTTLELGKAGMQAGRLRWLSSRGSPQAMDLRKGWLKVGEARKLPAPDVSWMRTPMRREDFWAWTQEA